MELQSVKVEKIICNIDGYLGDAKEKLRKGEHDAECLDTLKSVEHWVRKAQDLCHRIDA